VQIVGESAIGPQAVRIAVPRCRGDSSGLEVENWLQLSDDFDPTIQFIRESRAIGA
jgi:hypothetical protein